jgi:hypothetical protein
VTCLDCRAERRARASRAKGKLSPGGPSGPRLPGSPRSLLYLAWRRVRCARCGEPGVAEGSSKARPFRRATRGFCTPCAVCAFFQEEGDRGIGFALPPNFDPEGLRRPHIQRQFVRVLEAGGSELAMQEIDWTEVIEKWKVCPPESMSH